MDGPRLSPSEQRTLHGIEAMLQEQAPELDRRLRTLDPAGHEALWWTVCRPKIAFALGVLSVALLIVGVRFDSTAAVWAFAVLWVATLAVTLGALCRWTAVERCRQRRPR